MRTAVKEAFQLLQQRYESRSPITGLPTGFIDFDHKTAGLQGGDLIIVAARPSMGKCLAHDAEIVLESGRVATIEEICRERSAVVASMREDLRLARAEVSDFVDDGEKPVFEVTTRLGRRVETTLPHPFLTLDGWKPLSELSVGDYVGVPRSLPIFGTRRMRDCEVKLLAYLIGDGGLTGTVPRFTNTNPRIAEDFAASTAAFGGVRANRCGGSSARAPSYSVSRDPASRSVARGRFAAMLRDAVALDSRSA